MTFEVIARDAKGKESNLTLKKEKNTVKFGDTFVIEDETRAKEILNTNFCGKPVVKIVEDNSDLDEESLRTLTVAELKKIADAENITLTATKKDEIIAEIEVARAATNDDPSSNNDDDNADENK